MYIIKIPYDTRAAMHWNNNGVTGEQIINANTGLITNIVDPSKKIYVRQLMEKVSFHNSAKSLSAKPEGPTFKNSATTITQAPSFSEPTSDAPQHKSPNNPNKL